MRLVLLLLLAGSLCGQMTIREAVRKAGQSYPAVRAGIEQAEMAAGGVRLARTAFLPKGELLGQVNRATRNNIFGMVLPQSVIAPISGPPLAGNAGTNVWGTAAGFLIAWDAYDFGLREARVEEARAGQARAQAAAARQRWEAEVAAADAFLSLLAAGKLQESAAAARRRAEELEKVVAALARSGLKPGADAARAKAELALAEAQVVQAEQAAATARAVLAQFTGEKAEKISPLAPAPGAGTETGAVHPLIAEQAAAVEEMKAKAGVTSRSGMPRLTGQSAMYARGTGANPDGTTGGPGSGLGPNIYNWGVGLTLHVPLFEWPALRVQRQMDATRVRREEAKLNLVKRELSAQQAKAEAQHEAALRLARLIPAQKEAATAAEQQARARYAAGLAAMTEVSDAQRLLAQAEIDEGLAGLNVWRALLAVAAARGDLSSFLERAGQ